jgi:hypothetical protein
MIDHQSKMTRTPSKSKKTAPNLVTWLFPVG